MDSATVESYISQAAQLMNNPRFNAIVESTSSRTHRRAKANGGKLDGGGGMSADPLMAQFEAQAGFGGGSSTNSMQMLAEQQTQMIPKAQPQQKRKSGIPDIIQESFKKMPAMSGNMGTTMTPPASYYSNTNDMLLEQTTTPVQMPVAQPQAPVMPQATIDYNYIKYIIAEAVKENMKQMLNESATPTLTGLRMAGGNKIQFFDSKGNLYEGELKLKKKAQQ